MKSTNRKTFILGLGAQKSGTTWLSEYLRMHDKFDSGVLKEYHIWDALDVKAFRNRVVKLNPNSTATQQTRANAIKWELQQNPSQYFSYFDALFDKKITVSADITPSYSALGETRMRYIKKGFMDRDIDCKAVFLMRDPIARIKSALRFGMDKGGAPGVDLNGNQDFLSLLSKYYNGEHCKMRSRYDLAIKRARKAFGRTNVYVGIYETMFQDTEIERLSYFCGVEPMPSFAQTRVNKTKNTPESDPEIEADIKLFYKDVYDYCYKNFPETRTLWS